MTQILPAIPTRGLRAGDLVEIRSADEIMATLDERGEFENLPFMPEMLKFCGRRLTVNKVAHKLCDTISGTGIHKMTNAVHLTDARCDGAAHGGCQTACLLYWKEAWLKRVEPGEERAAGGTRIDLPLLEVNTRKEPGPDAIAALLLPGHGTAAGGAHLSADTRSPSVRYGCQDRQRQPARLVSGLSDRYLQPRSGAEQAGIASLAAVPRWSALGLRQGPSRRPTRRRRSSTCSLASWSGSSRRNRSRRP